MTGARPRSEGGGEVDAGADGVGRSDQGDAGGVRRARCSAEPPSALKATGLSRNADPGASRARGRRAGSAGCASAARAMEDTEAVLRRSQPAEVREATRPRDAKGVQLPELPAEAPPTGRNQLR